MWEELLVCREQDQDDQSSPGVKNAGSSEDTWRVLPQMGPPACSSQMVWFSRLRSSATTCHPSQVWKGPHRWLQGTHGNLTFTTFLKKLSKQLTTSSLNSHLETQEKSHTYHPLSRHRSHRRKQLDTGDREKRQTPNLTANSVFSTNVRIHPPTPERPKLYLCQELAPMGFACLWSYWRAYDLAKREEPTLTHLWEL